MKMLKKIQNIFAKQKKAEPVSPKVKHIKSFYTRVAIANEPDQWAIQLIKGPYTGLIYKYGKVSIDKEQTLLGTVKRSNIKYEYDILFVPENLRNRELSDEEEKIFHDFLGDVLVSLLYEYYTQEKLEIGNVDSVQPEEK